MFSIWKLEDEGIEGLIAHIANQVWAIKDLHPLGFTLDDLNNELHSMTLICALPEEYSSFVSSLMLIDNLNCSTIHAAFRNEKLNRECHPGILLDTNHQWISDKIRPTPPSSAIPSVPKVHSYFHHISNTPPFVPVPLVSPFVPMFPVSLISVSMPL